MEFKKINKQTINQINTLENNLKYFHAFRSLWADLVANNKECGIIKENLEEQQVRFLVLALGSMKSLQKILELK